MPEKSPTHIAPIFKQIEHKSESQVIRPNTLNESEVQHWSSALLSYIDVDLKIVVTALVVIMITMSFLYIFSKVISLMYIQNK